MKLRWPRLISSLTMVNIVSDGYAMSTTCNIDTFLELDMYENIRNAMKNLGEVHAKKIKIGFATA